jgi:serine/threonine-protein kinase
VQSSSLIDGKYQIVRPLGSGGMGTVYEGKHVGTGRRVAIKVVSPDALTKGPDVLDRFRREALATGGIESQYIAHVVDTGVDRSGSPYIVMELLVGEDLQGTLKRLRRLPADVAIRIAGQACMGLMKAHDAGVVHRDVKPGNLFLARRDEDVVVKLLDFGIAKVRLDPLPEVDRTSSGVMVGSPLYMSPEQARGKKTIDHRSDIFSLGVVLYELLTGKPPHDKAGTIGDLIVRICGEPARPIQGLAPNVNAATAAIVHKALAIDPNDRFARAVDMLSAIRAIVPGSLTLDAQALSMHELGPKAVRGTANSAPSAAAPEPATGAKRAPLPSKPDFTKSDINPDFIKDVGRPDVRKTDASRPEASKPEPSKREPPKKDLSASDSSPRVGDAAASGPRLKPGAALKRGAAKEPMQRRIFVNAAKRAAVLLWGEDGLNEIAQALDDDTREEFFRTMSVEDQIACRHVINWCFAAWEGPAKQNKAKMSEYVDRIFDFGFGVIRRAVLRLADPAVLVPRLPGFWKEDYSSGELTSVVDPDGRSATIHVSDHPFTETPHGRASVAEGYRYAFSQTRAKEVTESHGLAKPGVLMFRLRWTL